MSTPFVTEYTVASAQTATEFEAVVKALVGRGWQPQGGISVCEASTVGATANHQFFQVMVKYGPSPARPPRLG